MSSLNDPALVAKALAKAQSVEARLNVLAAATGPESPAILYGQSGTVVTQSAAGSYTWTCPAGITTVKVECWGAGSGGGGGVSSRGGEGGGGGGYAAEAAYAVTPGQVYDYQVGAGGSGGTTGNAGESGGDSYFDIFGAGNGVIGHGSVTTGGFQGAAGGTGSINSVALAGGTGGTPGGSATGGSGGGGSAGPAGAGNNGTASSGSTGTAGGAGTTDAGGGGAGGNAAASGSAGGAPGGGGGGAGAATASGQFTRDYYPVSSATYYGGDATGGNANQRRNNGTMYQGGETASGGGYNGTQKSLAIWPSSVASDLAGATIDKVTIQLLNLHSWYNWGMHLLTGYTNHTSTPSSWTGSGVTGTGRYGITEGSHSTIDITSTGIGAALQSGAARALALGSNTQPNMNLDNYGYFWGAGGGTNPPHLHVEYHTGAAPVKAGNGRDGQVRITYSTSTTVVAAVQPVAVTDPAGNQLAAGFTGQLTAIQPSSSPAVLESWHSASLQNGWTTIAGSPVPSYRLVGSPPNSVQLAGTMIPGTKADNTLIFTLPAGYRPVTNQHVPLCTQGTSIAINTVPLFSVHTDGTVTCLGLNSTGLGFVHFSETFPLDL